MVTDVPGDMEGKQGCAAICHFAMDLIVELERYNTYNPETPLNIRIGINCGSVVAGIVGKKRFMYDIWGDAVNMASRMESTGVAGRIQISKKVMDAIAALEEFTYERRGLVNVKGIGEVLTFFLTSRTKDSSEKYWKPQYEEEDHMHSLTTTLETLQTPKSNKRSWSWSLSAQH